MEIQPTPYRKVPLIEEVSIVMSHYVYPVLFCFSIIVWFSLIVLKAPFETTRCSSPSLQTSLSGKTLFAIVIVDGLRIPSIASLGKITAAEIASGWYGRRGSGDGCWR